MSLPRGARLGPYEVLSLLGAGGMGEVYRARDPRIRREVAIKVVAPDAKPDPVRMRRFADEARAAGSLSHPNILVVYDVGEADGWPYVVFELLEGSTLRDRLAAGPLAPTKAVDLAVQVVSGLAAAHEKGIVHRDLKPENLHVARDGRVKILDFGLAKLRPALDPEAVVTDTGTTAEGAVVGTAAYMSPEQVKGQPVDARSDIFSFGSVLYEMLTGKRAFPRDSAAETMAAILKEDPPDLSGAMSGVPPALERILRRCLHKDPGERFQSAKDLGFALGALTSSVPGELAIPTARRSRRWPLVAAAGLALALAAAAYSTWPRTAPSRTPIEVTPFTTFVGQETAPSFSPDGSQIAFAWSQETRSIGGFDLYTKVIGAEKPLRLTTHPATWLSPAWSPDGRVIAFSRSAEDGTGIYLVPATGGPERKLIGVDRSAFDYWLSTWLSWSPDGKLLAFRDGSGVALLDVETHDERRLDSPSPDCDWTWVPAFSPDGRSLAVVCVKDMDVYEMFVLPVSGRSTARRVLRAEAEISGLSWTADGRDILFTTGGLFRVSAGGGQPRALIEGRDASWPAISRAGNRLAFVQGSTNTNIWRVPLAGPTRPAGPPSMVVSSTRVQRFPALSPDGGRLAFESNRSGSTEIWMSKADGSDPERLTSLNGPLTGSPRWSPDGRTIAFDSREGGPSAIYLVSVDGGPARRLATQVVDGSMPSWSRDGRWLYFSVDQSRQIWRTRIEGGPSTPMTKGGGINALESADGRRVFYVKDFDRGDVWSVSVEGDDEQPVSGMPPLGSKWMSDWAPTASGIYFVDAESLRAGIGFFDFTTGKVQRVLDLPGRPEPWGGGLAVSSDGRSILFSQLDEVASDIMLVENFDSR